MYYNPLGQQGKRPSGELIDVSVAHLHHLAPRFFRCRGRIFLRPLTETCFIRWVAVLILDHDPLEVWNIRYG